MSYLVGNSTDLQDGPAGRNMGPPPILENNETALMKDRELLILRSIAILAASISLASGLLVGYWFIRMKRSFRHHLIMLLICSDFWKASWQLIYPAAVLTQGKIDRDSPFCQATGFFISMGIEASDFAVLVIAVHSALYIFRPGTRLGERGLYSYRFYLYGIWLAFPLLMASLAFVNEKNAYSSQGTYCYLPVRPIWKRLALAWIPRYIILVTILIIYVSIYIYVRIKFRTFRTNIGVFDLKDEDVEAATVVTPQLQNARGGVLPSLCYHGLIPPETSQTTEQQQTQVSISASDGFVAGRGGVGGAVGSDDEIQEQPQKQEQPRALTPLDQRIVGDGAHSPNFAMMDSAAGGIGGVGTELYQEASIVAELRKRRYSIYRQLRLLLIYPLVYAAMWVPPLISHSMQYTERFADNPSFALQCLVSFTLPVQCAVDCWLFATREKPWLYIPHTGKRTFWFSFAFWKHDCRHDHHDESEHKCRQKEEDEEEWNKVVWRNSNQRSLSIEQRAAYSRLEREKREAAQRLAEKKLRASGELGGILEEGGGGQFGNPHAQRGGSMLSGVSSSAPAGVRGSQGGRKPGSDWFDHVHIGNDGEDDDDDDDNDLDDDHDNNNDRNDTGSFRGRRAHRLHHSGNFSTLEIRIGSDAGDDQTTVREQSIGSGAGGARGGGYGSGVASGSGSRSVSVSAATSTTKRDSGSVIEMLDGCIGKGSGGESTSSPTPSPPPHPHLRNGLSVEGEEVIPTSITIPTPSTPEGSPPLPTATGDGDGEKEGKGKEGNGSEKK